MQLNSPLYQRKNQICRRILDIGVSVLLLLIFLPLLCSIAILIPLTTGLSPIFVQLRSGKDERPFPCLKFKTMKGKIIDAGSNEQHRLTKIGKILRMMGLDELPQLINILIGHMSLIGPRPTLPEQTARYNATERLRLSIKPGLTGWAQVNGRNQISWQKRIELDVYYLTHWSWRLDVVILWRTLFIPFQWKKTYGTNYQNDDFKR